MDEQNLIPQEALAEELAAEQPQVEEQVTVVDVQFRPGQKVYYFDPADFDIQTGDHLIIETARGPEYGVCSGGSHTIAASQIVPPLRRVLRFATEADEQQMQQMRSKEKKAYQVCLQKIADHKLDMQLVSAEYSFDGSKILFFFTADERVDFRELVKNLASIFHTRIELRQIGVRDKAKMVGGLGICGRPFCCASFLEDFQPVSIKMAKTQNLSLNPTKISGTCGRLMCCLKYEQEAYEDLIRTAPKAESFVDTPEGRGTVTDVNLLRQSVKVRMEDSPETVSCFKNCDICVLRSGKAKKNDPPIPADLAPISGTGKRPRPEPQENAPVLEAVKLRYSTEELAGEQVIDQQEQEKARKPKAPRPKKPRTEEERPAKKPRSEEKREKTEPEQLKTEDAEVRARRRRPFYHKNRRKQGGGE